MGRKARSSQQPYGEMPVALAQLWETHRGQIYAMLFSQTGSKEDAEEILSDTFLRAMRGYSRFRGDSALSTWVYKIAMNLGRNRYWYHVRRGKNVSDSVESGDYELVNQTPSIANELETGELEERINVGMKDLSEKHREILILRGIRKLSYEEIAEIIGIEVGTVKSRLSRARENLISVMNKSGTEYDEIDEEHLLNSSRDPWQGRLAYKPHNPSL